MSINSQEYYLNKYNATVLTAFEDYSCQPEEKQKIQEYLSTLSKKLKTTKVPLHIPLSEPLRLRLINKNLSDPNLKTFFTFVDEQIIRPPQVTLPITEEKKAPTVNDEPIKAGTRLSFASNVQEISFCYSDTPSRVRKNPPISQPLAIEPAHAAKSYGKKNEKNPVLTQNLSSLSTDHTPLSLDLLHQAFSNEVEKALMWELASNEIDSAAISAVKGQFFDLLSTYAYQIEYEYLNSEEASSQLIAKLLKNIQDDPLFPNALKEEIENICQDPHFSNLLQKALSHP